jgi:tetratricopeptide repeat protein
MSAARIAIRLDERHRGARGVLGVVLLEQSRPLEAISELEQAVTPEDADPALASALVVAYTVTGQMDRAFAMLALLQAKHPDAIVGLEKDERVLPLLASRTHGPLLRTMRDAGGSSRCRSKPRQHARVDEAASQSSTRRPRSK